jgi:hypothetical protein
VRRLHHRHPSSLLQVIDFQKELPVDEELDKKEVPGLPAKPECSFAFIEADVREHLGHLEDSMVEAVVARLRSFEADVFETRSMSRAPPHLPIDLDITLRQDAEPIARRAYPVAAHHLPELDRQIQLLLNTGMICPSFSDYAAPILFTPKKDGKLRLVCDYRALNAQTVRDRFPTPTAADLISSTTGGRLFSKIDLLAGCHQLRVREIDIHKTTLRGFVEKCEEAKHSPPRRAAEDDPVTAQHDVPRWARGRWRPAAVRLRGWAVAAAPGSIFTFTG